jgi:phosphonate transport system substrate-binding protein
MEPDQTLQQGSRPRCGRPAPGRGRLFPRITALFLVTGLLLLAFPSGAASAEQALKIGVASMITPVDAVRYYQDVIDYVGKAIGEPVQMVHRRTYDEMDSLLERGEVNVAFICSAPYVKNRQKFGVELLVAPSVNGSATYRSYIIVHKDSPLASFPELKGKAFAFTDPKSNTGKLYPTFLLKTTSRLPEDYFSRIVYSYSHNKSIEMVAKRLVDGAAVESIVYEHMRQTGSPYAGQTRIIKRSPSYGTPPVVVTKSISPGLKARLRKAFLDMNRSASGKAILDAMMIDGFIEVSDRNYDSIRDMERAVAGTPARSRQTKDRRTVYFGVIPRDNPRIMYEKYQPLLDYLAGRTPYAYELVLKKNYEDTVAALGSGEVDVALLGPLTYLEARAQHGAVCILKSRGADGSAGYRSVVVKRAEAPLGGLQDLKGKRVAFASSRSTSGNLLPRYLLASSGLHLSDLGEYANFDFHDSVVKAVLKGQYDAGAVRDSVARKYEKLGIAVIASSDPIPTGPLVVGPGTPFSIIENIKRALLALDPRDNENQKILNRLDEEFRGGFVEASDEDYGEIRAKINAVPQTCGRSCHPKIQL